MTTYHSKDTFVSLRFWDGRTAWHGPALDGPGWYISAAENEGYTEIYKHQKVSPAKAEEIARAIDLAVTVAGQPTRLFNHVQGLNRHLGTLLEQERTRLDELIAKKQKTVKDLEALVERDS